MAAKTELTGKVISDKMTKSRVVAVERQVRHGVYGKTRRLTSTFMAHDETNATKAGDVVAMAESRPARAPTVPCPSQVLNDPRASETWRSSGLDQVVSAIPSPWA
jgi:small subunit ribosomal protein S17